MIIDGYQINPFGDQEKDPKRPSLSQDDKNRRHVQDFQGNQF